VTRTSGTERARHPRARQAVARGAWIAVALALAAVAGVGALAVQAARRDRAALLDAFGAAHVSRVAVASREVAAELAGIGQHLEFAARLVESSAPATDQRREFEALLAVVRAYRLIAVYDAAGRQRVVALDPLLPPSWSPAAFSEELAETARAAVARRGLVLSTPLGEPGSPWHRVFATPISRGGRNDGALVVIVDLSSAFERLRLVAPYPTSKLVLLGPHGRAAPLTDPALVGAIEGPERNGRFAEVLSRMRTGEAGTVSLSGADAARLGLGDADAVAVFAPIRVGDAGHWSFAVVSSNAILRPQDRAIGVRMGLLAAAFAVVLGGLSAYLVVSARRAIAVQERLRTAEQVAHLHEKAEKILENVPVGVIALDDGGRISAFNRASRERVPPSALGAPLERAFPDAPGEATATLRSLFDRARRSGVVQSVVAEPVALSGGESYFAVHAVPLEHPLPDVRVLLVLEDVTELRALSSQLLRAEKLATVGVLAAGIAHEVGTPLGVVRGRAELLLSKLGHGHPNAESARIIVDEIDRISRVIRELLDFSRVSRAAAVAVPLEGAARDVSELLAYEARTRGVEVEVDVPPGLPPLAADADQLKQVLVNLALNALDASPPGGRVAIRAQPEPGAARARVEIADEGAGIPDALRHRVFDPFFTTKKRGKGTGLGLTIAAQIVRNHGGEIDLESASGKGTRVVVSWPLASSGPEEVHGATEERAYPRRR
jgi:two-component system, NtrC family, sensor histidine kinase HydH